MAVAEAAFKPKEGRMDWNEVAREVLGLIAASGVAVSEDVHQAEQVIWEQVLRVGARALEMHLEGRRLGYEGSSRACPSCGRNQRFVEHRPRTLATRLG